MPLLSVEGPVDFLRQRIQQLKHVQIKKKTEVNDASAPNFSLASNYTRKRKRYIDDDSSNQGDEALRKFAKINPIFTTNSTHQRSFTEIYLQACVKGLYGASFDANEVRIKKAFGINEIFPFASLRCPRRFGKTEITAQFVAQMMFVHHDFNCAVFSPSRRQSNEFMLKVRTYVRKIAYECGIPYTTFDGQDNKEIFTIVIDGNNRRFTALPSAESTVRGTGANLVICEEVAAMDFTFFKRVVLPMLTVDNCALICISTTQGEENFYDKLLSLTNLDGSASIFNSYTFTLSCDACAAAGRSHLCKHKQHELPSWMTGARTDIVQNIYLQMDDPKTMMQEVMGISNKAHDAAFEREDIDKLFDQTKVRLTKRSDLNHDKVKEVFMFIDPNGGGDASDLAIFTFFKNGNNTVILGMESLPTKSLIAPDSDANYITMHIQHIRQMEEFMHSKIICFVENNTGPHALQGLAQYFPDDPNLIRPNLEGMKKGDVHLLNNPEKGIHTRQELKQAGHFMLRLQLKNKAISFYENFFSLYRPPGDDGRLRDNVHHIKKVFKDQWVRYSIIKIFPSDADTGPIKYAFGGKGSSGQRDDLITAFLMGTIWQAQWRESRLATMDTLH
jgi:hypothetical protein